MSGNDDGFGRGTWVVLLIILTCLAAVAVAHQRGG